MIIGEDGYVLIKGEDSDDLILEKTVEYVGRIVSVWAGVGIRRSFETQLSVSGTLEKHPHMNQFRIVLSKGTYTYFDLEYIDKIVIREPYSSDGASAIIKLSFISS